jgi:serine/threonine protein kinase
MAPEQCSPRDHDEIGAPADIWGLGVTLFQAITGHRPFSDPGEREVDDPYDRFPQLLESPELLDSSVPPALAEPVMACLSKDIKERPTAGELALALEPLVAALPRRPVLGRRRPRLR